MRSVFQKLGVVIFWLSWPFWLVYFRTHNQRSRILIVADGHALLLKSWLGRGQWGLTGGGANKGESIEDCAAREIKEEIGLETAATAFRPLGKRINNHAGLKFNAEFFVLELSEIPEISIQKSEISEAKWFKLDEVIAAKPGQDVLFAMEKYRPISQAELL